MKLNLEELKQTLLSRRVITESGCWEWMGSRSDSGHGNIRRDGRLYGTHRLACIIWIGPPPKGDHVQACHHCDNPPCFNPDHLYWGTQKTNSEDMMRRGRGKQQFDSLRTRGTKHVGNKLSESDVIAIKRALIAGERGTMARLARQYGVTIQNIFRIKTGKLWGWLECV